MSIGLAGCVKTFEDGAVAEVGVGDPVVGPHVPVAPAVPKPAPVPDVEFPRFVKLKAEEFDALLVLLILLELLDELFKLLFI